VSRALDLARRVARGAGVSDVRALRGRLDGLEEAVRENRRLEALLEEELRAVEQQVGDVAQSFLDRR
jgi:hypothetical protein